jgi:hypothetical protein
LALLPMAGKERKNFRVAGLWSEHGECAKGVRGAEWSCLDVPEQAHAHKEVGCVEDGLRQGGELRAVWESFVGRLRSQGQN